MTNDAQDELASEDAPPPADEAPAPDSSAPPPADPAPADSPPDPAQADPAPAPRPRVLLSAAPKDDDGLTHLPDSLQLELGLSAVLSWTAENATSVELTGPGAGPQAITDGSTSLVVTPADELNDYSMVAIAGDQRSEPSAIHISTHLPGLIYSPHAQVMAPPSAAQINAFTAAMKKGAAPPAGQVSVPAGATLTFRWEVAGLARALEIDNGVGDLTPYTDANQDDASGSGSLDVVFSPPPGETQVVYTLTLTPGDLAALPVTAQVTVAIATAPVYTPGLIHDSNFLVGKLPFVDFFQTKIPHKHGTPFPVKLSSKAQDGFHTVFDRLTDLVGKAELTLNEFIVVFSLCYWESGIKFGFSIEDVQGGQKGDGFNYDAYMFEQRVDADGKLIKGSYNVKTLGNQLAGDQLKAARADLKLTDAQVAAWNGQTYPMSHSDEIKTAARECDFYKFRGHGLNQITWRDNFKTTVEPTLLKKVNKGIDDLTHDELSELFKDPDVYIGAVRLFYDVQYYDRKKKKRLDRKPLEYVNDTPPNWEPMARTTNTPDAYFHGVRDRCDQLLQAITDAGGISYPADA